VGGGERGVGRSGFKSPHISPGREYEGKETAKTRREKNLIGEFEKGKGKRKRERGRERSITFCAVGGRNRAKGKTLK